MDRSVTAFLLTLLVQAAFFALLGLVAYHGSRLYVRQDIGGKIGGYLLLTFGAIWVAGMLLDDLPMGSIAVVVAILAWFRARQTTGVAGEVSRLSRIIASDAQRLATLEDVVRGNRPRKQAEEELLNLVESRPELREVMQRYSVTRSELKRIYEDLFSLGAAQWVRGRYVAVSALVKPATLDFALRSFRAKGSVDLDTTVVLLRYFKSGSRGPI